MKNFTKCRIIEEARTELHDALNLTGAEISVNLLPVGANVPFIHSHKQNEEIYAILEGEGNILIDGESVPIKAGDWLRISPSAKRQLFAAEDKNLKYICIQVKSNSLEEYTLTDAIIES